MFGVDKKTVDVFAREARRPEIKTTTVLAAIPELLAALCDTFDPRMFGVAALAVSAHLVCRVVAYHNSPAQPLPAQAERSPLLVPNI